MVIFNLRSDCKAAVYYLVCKTLFVVKSQPFLAFSSIRHHLLINPVGLGSLEDEVGTYLLEE